MQRIGDERVVPGKGLAKGVDRRSADVAEHDPDRADHQLRQGAVGVALAAQILFGGDLGGSRGGNAHTLKQPSGAPWRGAPP